MFKIAITTTALQTKSGISSKTGKPYEITEQPAWIFLVDQNGRQQPYPVQIMVMLEKGQHPYALGDYVLHPSSVQSGRFGSLQIRLDIRKVEANVKAAA